MTDTVISMIGHVGSDVSHRQVGSGVDLSTFRLASTPRRYDRRQERFVDGTTTWISVECWRWLAMNVRDSIQRGDPVIVVGKLKTDEWTTDDGARQSRMVLEATSVGHDLSRGVDRFRRVNHQAEGSSPAGFGARPAADADRADAMSASSAAAVMEPTPGRAEGWRTAS